MLFLVDRGMVKSLWRRPSVVEEFSADGQMDGRLRWFSKRTIGEETGADIGRNSEGIWWHHVNMCNLCIW